MLVNAIKLKEVLHIVLKTENKRNNTVSNIQKKVSFDVIAESIFIYITL